MYRTHRFYQILKLTAQQTEQLNRPRPLLSLLMIGLVSLPWWLLWQNGTKARQQRAEMALRAADFFAQLSTYERNRSAQRFDQLAANLGFMPNDPSGSIIHIDLEAERAYQMIDVPLDQFLKTQSAKSSGPLDAPPPALQIYLETYAEPIAIVQTHLLEQERPQWDMTLERMFDPGYPFPGFLNVRNLQRVLLLTALDYHHREQQVEMLTVLEASWQLNQALLQRPDLVSQILVSAVSEQQAGLLRHLDNVPEHWQARLAQQTQHPSVLASHQFETWVQYKSLQRSWRSALARTEISSTPGEQLISMLSYWFSPAYGLQLGIIDTTQTAHRALTRLKDLDVCSTTQRDVERMLEQEKTARWNQATAIVPTVLARRWKTAGDRALTLELTQKVLEIKGEFQATQQWPATLPNTASTACPGEHWVYTHNGDSDKNMITLSLSSQPAPTLYKARVNPGPPPFHYQFPDN